MNILYGKIAGNIRFRDLIADSIQNYINASTRLEKALVVQRIIDEIHAEGGKFLKKVTSEYHQELTSQQCKDKVGHAIRDAVTSQELKKKSFKFEKKSQDEKSDHKASSAIEQRTNRITRDSPENSTEVSLNSFSSRDRVVNGEANVKALSTPDEIPSSARSASLFVENTSNRQQMAKRRSSILMSESNVAVASIQTGGHENDTINERLDLSSSLMQNPMPIMSSMMLSPEYYQSHQIQRNWVLPNQLHSSRHSIDLMEQTIPSSRHRTSSRSIRRESGNDIHFLDAINDVLGPLHPDTEDPIATILSESQYSTQKEDTKKPPPHR